MSIKGLKFLLLVIYLPIAISCNSQNKQKDNKPYLGIWEEINKEKDEYVFIDCGYNGQLLKVSNLSIYDRSIMESAILKIYYIDKKNDTYLLYIDEEKKSFYKFKWINKERGIAEWNDGNISRIYINNSNLSKIKHVKGTKDNCITVGSKDRTEEFLDKKSRPYTVEIIKKLFPNSINLKDSIFLDYEIVDSLKYDFNLDKKIDILYLYMAKKEMKESKVLIFKNNGLDKYSKWLLNDQFPIYSLRDYDKIIVKNNYLTFEYKTDTDDRFNNQHYLTFKLMNNGIYLHKYGLETYDAKLDRDIPTKIWTKKDFGHIKFEEISDDFLNKLYKV